LKTQQCRIGRNPSNDLVINDRAAEDFHAVIMLGEDNFIFIEDQNSRYGTMVNGERVSKVQLFPGDEVQIGFCRIDWESRTGFQPSLNEIEVIPNLSVPIKRPIQNNSALADTVPNNNLNHLNKGDASKELANSLIETEAQLERIENTIPQIETVEKSEAINEAIIPSEDSFNEMTIVTKSEVASDELMVSEISHDTEAIPNNSDQLPILESINDDADLNKDNKIEDVTSDNNLPFELHQQINEVEIPIASDIQSKEEPIVSKITDDTNSISSFRSLKINEPHDEHVDSLNGPLNTFSNKKKSGLIRKDSIQILMAIALTCLLLAAGWLIGQAS
jgi:hypothetical protein